MLRFAWRYTGSDAVVRVIGVVLLGLFSSISGAQTERIRSAAAAEDALPLTHRLNPSFEPNRGQFHPAVRYAANRYPYQVYLKSDKIVLDLADGSTSKGEGQGQGQGQGPRKVAIALLGATRDSLAVPGRELQERSNYFMGSESAQWVTGVPHYDAVTFLDAYPGIDLRHYAQGGKLEYDFLVKPGADPSGIRLRIEGADRSEVDPAGDLIIHVAGQVLKHRRPVAYQTSGSDKRAIAARYRPVREGEFALALGEHDPSTGLTIDPIIDFATVYGGGVAALSAATDPSGAVYLSGATTWPGFPTVNPFAGENPDERIGVLPVPVVFVTKIDPLGQSVHFSTFFGGSGGAVVRGIHVDAAGGVYLAGQAGNGLPTTSGAFLGATAAPWVPAIYAYYSQIERTDQSLAFVTKLHPEGNALAYSTYLAQVDQVSSLAVDPLGAAQVVGATRTASFPATPGAFQESRVTETGKLSGYLAKLSPDGRTLQYGSYFGGTGGDTVITAVALDQSGSSHFTGYTLSPSLPLQQPFQSVKRGAEDAFVAKLSADGSKLVYSSYLGGDDSNCLKGADFGTAIALDVDGAVYVAGRSFSHTNFPVSSGTRGAPLGYVDAFVTKLDGRDGSLLRSVFLGGNDQPNDVACGSALGYGEHPRGLSVNPDGTLTVSGYGATANLDDPGFAFPLVNPVATFGKGFVSVLAADTLAPVFSTVFPAIAGAVQNRYGDLYAFGIAQSGFLRKPETTLLIPPGALANADPGGSVAYLARILRPTAHLVLSTDSDTVTQGRAFDLKASLSGIHEAGEIEFLDGDSVLGRTPVAAGAANASFQVTAAPQGFHRYAARFVSPLLPQGLRSGTRYVTLVAAECE